MAEGFEKRNTRETVDAKPAPTPEVQPPPVVRSNAAKAEVVTETAPGAETSFLTSLEGGEGITAVNPTPQEGGGPPSDSPESDRPDPAAQPVEFAQWKADENNTRLQEIKARRDAGDPAAAAEYTEALRANTADLARSIGSMTPEQQREFLTAGGSRAADALVKSALDSDDQATINAVVTSLAQGGETLGRQNIELLGGVIGRNNSPEIRTALQAAIRGGNGALLAMSAAKNTADPLAASTTRDRIHIAVQDVTNDFSSATSRMKAVQGEMVAVAARMRESGISEAEVNAWQQREREKNKDLFAEHDRAARTYASTLEGQAYAIDDVGGGQADIGQRETYQRSLGMAGDLAFANGASEFTASALQRKGQGDRTWLDTVGDQNLGEDQQGLMKHVVGQGAMTGLAAATAAGDTDTVEQVLSGLEQSTDGNDAKAVARIRKRIGALREQGVSAEELKTRLAEEVRSAGEGADDQSLMRRLAIGASIGANVRSGLTNLPGAVLGVTDAVLTKVPGIPGADTRLHAGIGKMSNAIELLTSGMAALDDGSVQNIVGAAINGANVTADAAALLGRQGIAKLMGRANLPLGVIMSTVDLVGNLANGDYEGAAVASLPLVGAGAGMAIAGPPGAAVGLAIGGVLSVGANLAGYGSDAELQKKTAAAIQDVFKERGVTGPGAANLAERFAGLDAKDVGERFRHMADTLGVDEQTLVRQLADAPPDYRSYFFTEMNSSVVFEPGEDGKPVRQDNRRYAPFVASMEAVAPGAADENWQEPTLRANAMEQQRQIPARYALQREQRRKFEEALAAQRNGG